MSSLSDFIEKYGLETVDNMFMEYFIIMVAKAKKYDELVKTINTNGCNLAMVRKVLESDLYDNNSEGSVETQ